MDERSKVAMMFLVFGGAFVGSLLWNLSKLLFGKNDMRFDGKSLLYHYRYTILSLIALLVLVMYIIPSYEG